MTSVVRKDISVPVGRSSYDTSRVGEEAEVGTNVVQWQARLSRVRSAWSVAGRRLAIRGRNYLCPPSEGREEGRNEGSRSFAGGRCSDAGERQRVRPDHWIDPRSCDRSRRQGAARSDRQAHRRPDPRRRACHGVGRAGQLQIQRVAGRLLLVDSVLDELQVRRSHGRQGDDRRRRVGDLSTAPGELRR